MIIKHNVRIKYTSLTVGTFITNMFKVQWVSEILPSLGFKWPKRGWVANDVDFKWDLKSGSAII